MYEGTANQLTEMVPVDRIIAQFAPVVQQAKATNIIIDNVSDLKPVPMTTEAVLRFAWDPAPFLNASSPMAAARAFYAQWGARQHGMKATDPAAAAFSSLWADLFALPYLQMGTSDNFFGTVMKQNAPNAARAIAASGKVPSDALGALRGAVQRLTNNTDASGASVVAATAALLARAEQLALDIPAPRAGFFRSHTLLQARLAAGGVAMVVGTAAALEAAAAGNWTTAGGAAAAACAGGAAVLAGFRDAEAASSPGVWAGWFAGDYLSDMQGAHDACRQLAAAVAAPGKGGALPAFEEGNLWYTWDFRACGSGSPRIPHPRSERIPITPSHTHAHTHTRTQTPQPQSPSHPNPRRVAGRAGGGGRVPAVAVGGPQRGLCPRRARQLRVCGRGRGPVRAQPRRRRVGGGAGRPHHAAGDDLAHGGRGRRGRPPSAVDGGRLRAHGGVASVPARRPQAG